MADTKITGATDITTLASTDVIPVARPGNTTAYKATMAEIHTFSAGGVYNVQHYGAVGNGVTDDTAAIQAAVDALRTAEGGVLYFPAGKYHTTSTVSVNLARPSNGYQYSMEIRGDGGASQIYNTAVDGTDCLYILGTTSDMATLHIHDLSFEGAGAFYPTPAATGSALHLRRCIMPAMIDNVYARNFGGGACFKLQSTWLTTILNCRGFYSSMGVYTLTDAVPGIYGSPVNISLLNSDFSGNNNGVYNGSYHMRIDNCIIEGNTTAGINITGAQFLDISNGYFESNGIDITLVSCAWATIKKCHGDNISLDANCDSSIVEQNDITSIVNASYFSRFYSSIPTTETGGSNIYQVPDYNLVFAANDTTPSVKYTNYGYKFYTTANAVPTTITNFDDGLTGQEIWVYVNDVNTTFNFSGGTYLVGNAHADYVASQYDMIHAIKSTTGYWYCQIIDAIA